MKPTNTIKVMKLRVLQDFKRIFEDEEHCDLKIQMGDGVTLNAHKTILIARSPVFHKMLTSNMKEATTSVVDIEDFDSKTMRNLLLFIYCEEVQDLQANAGKLIHAAEKYDLYGLKEMCIEELIANLSVENIIDTLIIADQVSETEKLIKACIPIIHT
jgi:speckle-type POZ protein